MLGKLVPVIRALQQLLVLLYAMQLGYYRSVLRLIERKLDIGRFEVETAYTARNSVGVAGLVATHYPVEVLRVFQGFGSYTDFFQALPVNLRRVEAVALLGFRVVRFRYTECFHLFVTLRRGVAVVILDSLRVLFHLRCLAAEQRQPFGILKLAVEVGDKVADDVAVLVHLHELAALYRRHSLQVALLVESFNGTHFPLLFVQDQQHVLFLPLCGRGHSVFAHKSLKLNGYGNSPVQR